MNPVLARLDAYERLIRLDRPIGILLLLWPTLWGLWLARGGVPNLLVYSQKGCYDVRKLGVGDIRH